MLRTPFAVLAVLASLALLAGVGSGCTSVQTYPPTAGKPTTRPNIAPGPALMTASLKESHRVSGLGAPLVFNLPAGLEPHTWSRVAAGLPEGAVPMRAGDENVFSVQQIRLSGGRAEVDVVYPDRGVYQLMTVRLRNAGLGGWKVESAYRWLIPANPPLPNDPMIAIEAERAAREAEEAARLAAEAEAARLEEEREAAERAAAEAAAIEAAEEAARAANMPTEEAEPAAVEPTDEPTNEPTAEPADEPVPA